MKKKNLLLLFLLVLFGQVLIAQDHHWPLAADVNDVIGNLNGSNNGVTFSTDSERGDVAIFNGADAFVDLPSFVSGCDELTISLWFKPDFLSQWKSLYAIGESVAEHFRILPSNGIDGKMEFVYKYDDVDKMWPGAYPPLMQGEWHHSVFTFTPNKVSSYIDGIKSFEANTIKSVFTINDVANFLGKNYYGDFFLGSMNDLRVYKTAFTESEVASLYVATEKKTGYIAGGFVVNNISETGASIDVILNDAGKVFYTILPSNSPEPNIDDLVNSNQVIDVETANSIKTILINEGTLEPRKNYKAYFVTENSSEVLQDHITVIAFKTLADKETLYHWPLTENTNEIENGLDGINDGVTFTSDAVMGPVAEFKTGFIKLPSFMSGLDEMTISIWFRMDQALIWARIYSLGLGPAQGDPGYREGFWLVPFSGWDQKMGLELTNPTGHWYQAIAESDINTGKWYHSTLVFNEEYVTGYLNGQEIFKTVTPVPFNTINDNENYLGKSYWPDALWDGAMTDMKVYAKVFTSAEVLALFESYQVDQEAPTVPENLTATNITSTSVRLEWEASTDNVEVAEYYILINDVITDTTESTSILIDGLNPETEYQVTVKAADTSGNISEESNSVTVNTLVNILENTLEYAVQLYPNPVSEVLEINSSIDLSSIEAYSTSGAKLKIWSMQGLNTGVINMSDFDKGFYFLRIVSVDQNVVIRKIVKQ
jgi:hypothetical protein